MSRPGLKQVGAFVRHQAPELTRLWRLARSSDRTEVFPGLLDGVIESFFEETGAAVERGAAPWEAFARIRGALRWPPGLVDELSAEWAIVREVLQTACESVNCEPDATDWLLRAVDAADAGTAAIDGGRGQCPPGIVVVVMLSSVAPVQRAEQQ